jgi:hypothetical protein
MALFDPFRNLVHDVTATVFGEVATWTPLAGGAEQTATVHFNRPDKIDGLGDVNAPDWEFSALDTWIEYRSDQFPALKAAADNKARELIEINGTTYKVVKVLRVHDGATFKAQLREVTP